MEGNFSLFFVLMNGAYSTKAKTDGKGAMAARANSKKGRPGEKRGHWGQEKKTRKHSQKSKKV